MAAKTAGLALDRALFRVGERVCVAVSGGADSVALLLALAEAKPELGVGLRAAHVHHGLRGQEADGDEAFVREVCERLAVPLKVFRVDTMARQAAEGEGLEEAARELRYAALRGLMESGEADVVATAHTLDDQAETVMMKLLRGAWTEGLGGISPVVESGDPAGEKQILRYAQDDDVQGEKIVGTRTAGLPGAPHSGRDGTAVSGRVVRPLLRVRRAEVETFLRERGQGWREDASNADMRLMRNRVRRELMPILRSFNPQADEMLANAAELARDEQAYWDIEIGRMLPQLLLPGKPVRGGGRAVGTAVGHAAVAMELEKLRGMGAAMRRRVVRGAAKAVDARLSFEETAKVLALAGLGGYAGVQGKVGSRLELRGGLRVERSARELRLWKTGQ